MITEFAEYTADELLKYLSDIKPDDHFDQGKWNCLTLEILSRLLRNHAEEHYL